MAPAPRLRPGASWRLTALALCGIVTAGCEVTIDGEGGGPPPVGGDDTGDDDAAPADAGDPPAPDAAIDGAPLPPLTECAQPSIDRLEQWLASGEGLTEPATGSMLVAEGDHHVAHIEFIGAEWHVAVVWLGNQFEAQADLSRSSGFTITYRATDRLYVQLRPASHWSGGDKYVVELPATGGALASRRVSFDATAWTTLDELGTPSYPFSDAIREVRGLVFVGETANDLTVTGLRIDGFEPPCL